MDSKTVSDKTHPTLRVEIEDLSRSGSGVARQDTPQGRRVVFVPQTLSGDVAEVRIVREEKRFVEAELVELIQASPDRVSPKCEVFGRCGGCAWQHVPYKKQWQVKRDGVFHALARTQVSLPESHQEFPAENPFGYRNRIQLRGVGAEVGFFSKRSRSLVAIQRCEIAREELNRVLPEIRKKGLEKGGEFKVEIEVLPDGQVRESWNDRHGALGFRQVNDEQNEKLKHYVQGHIEDGAHVLDLYGGNGNLSLGLEKRVAWVDCVDVGAPRGGGPEQPPNYRFFQTDAPKWMDRRAHEFEKGVWALKGPGVAIIDPPREGLGEQQNKISRSLDLTGVQKIIAVGCDPDSFARDVARFQKQGWKIVEISIFDLFPQTPHVEAVGVLVRRAETRN